MKDEDFFENMSDFLEENGQELEEDGKEMVEDFLIQHQVSLMTGSKLLVNMPAKYKKNILLVQSI